MRKVSTLSGVSGALAALTILALMVSGCESKPATDPAAVAPGAGQAKTGDPGAGASAVKDAPTTQTTTEKPQ